MSFVAANELVSQFFVDLFNRRGRCLRVGQDRLGKSIEDPEAEVLSHSKGEVLGTSTNENGNEKLLWVSDLKKSGFMQELKDLVVLWIEPSTKILNLDENGEGDWYLS